MHEFAVSLLDESGTGAVHLSWADAYTTAATLSQSIRWPEKMLQYVCTYNVQVAKYFIENII